MYSELKGILGSMSEPAASAASTSYVVMARRVFLSGDGVEHYSEPVPMEGYNAVFVEVTVMAMSGTVDPTLNLYVQVSNDRQNWDTLPLGSAPVALALDNIAHFTLSQTTIGQQISAAWVRLMYVTTGDMTAIIGVGLDRKRLGM